MKFKDFLDRFIRYNKRIYKKLILISILIFYFAFLIFYNHFRVILGDSEGSSWSLGITFALILTIALVLVIDAIRVVLLLSPPKAPNKFVLNIKNVLTYIISFLPLVIITVIIIGVLIAVITILVVLYGETGVIVSLATSLIVGGIWIAIVFWVFFAKTAKVKRLRK